MHENVVIDYRAVVDKAAKAHGLTRRKFLILLAPDMTERIGETFQYDYIDRVLMRGSRIDYGLWTALMASIEKLASERERGPDK